MSDNIINTLCLNKKRKKNKIFVVNDLEYINNTAFALSLKKSKIPEAGMGVFAEEVISKDKFIGYYDGKLVHRKKDHYDADYSMEIDRHYIIDGSIYPRPLTSMINDSYKTKHKNNCKFVIREDEHKVELWSTKKINSGDELFIDYGEDYWSSRSDGVN